MDGAIRAQGSSPIVQISSDGLNVMVPGSKMGRECFDMNTLGLESWKALELARLLGWSVQDSKRMNRAIVFQASKLKIFYTCRES